MENNQIYREFIEVPGAAAVKTIYSTRVKEDRSFVIDRICANIYTTIFGDYTTAKYISVGIEHQGKQYLIDIKDVNATYGAGVCINPKVILTQGDRIFVTFEAVATTETYQVLICGREIFSRPWETTEQA